MTVYPYVRSWFDYGTRTRPALGLMYHMAEGGGTVSYLDDKGTPPTRNVSVHAVCEYSGRVVQMLPWGHVAGSLNPADRSVDTGYYGHSALVAVLGGFWTDPNTVTLAMEIEGHEVDGPNPDQVAGAIAWGLDMKARYPTLRGALGHTDQTDTKPCPGLTPAMKAIFTGVGGHGLWTATGDDMPYELKFERWKWNGTEITTVGAPIVNGTVDYGSRLAILSDTGGANRRLESVGRTTLTPVSGALDDPFYDALTGYAIPVPCTPQALADAKAAGRESFRKDVEAIP